MSIERQPGLISAFERPAPSPSPVFPGPLSGPEWAAPRTPFPGPLSGTEWTAAPGTEEAPHRRRSTLGIMSVLLVLAAVALEVGGILTSISQEYTIGIVLALLSIVASVAAVVVGVVALVLGRGRRWGAAGVLLGLLANPLLQNWLLSAAS